MTDGTSETEAVFGSSAIRTLVVPFAVFMVGFALADLLPMDSPYPVTYTAVIAVTAVAMLVAGPGYRRAPFRVSPAAIGIGIVGLALWIGLWWLDTEFLGLGPLIGGERSAYNPFETLAGGALWGFLTVRFAGLVLVVPIIEEFFVRGFLMRFMDAKNWDALPLGTVTRASAGAVAVYAVLSHAGEPLAALAWFSLVTWLYARTGNLWDCVVAHATTNALLGIYVIATGTWALW